MKRTKNVKDINLVEMITNVVHQFTFDPKEPVNEATKEANEAILAGANMINGMAYVLLPVRSICTPPAYADYTRLYVLKALETAKHWDMNLLDPVKCYYSKEHGCFFLTDGLKRLVASQVQQEPLRMIPALLRPNQFTFPEAAGVFLADNNHDAVSYYDQYKAGKVRGDTWALQLQEIQEEFGFTMGPEGHGKGHLRCVDVMKWSLGGPLGYEGTRAIFRCIYGIGWDRTMRQIGYECVRGVAICIKHYRREGFDLDEIVNTFIETFKGADFANLRRQAKEKYPQASTLTAVAKFFVETI